MDPNHATQTYEIVCLEHQSGCLYAEVVQQVSERQRSWLRPLALSLGAAEALDKIVYDLRGGSDLLWPQIQLRAALDMELLSVLAMLPPEKPYTSSALDKDAHRQLQGFLKRLCTVSTQEQRE
ncbi:MAG: hypothetical protein ACFCU8_16150 [Thermosynechococcaceae cyanobacterium]